MTARRFRLIIACIGFATLLLFGPAARLAFVSVLLLLAPGFLLARLLPGREVASAFVRPVVWLGLSMSLIALLYQWVTALGLSLPQAALDTLAIGCAVGVVLVLWNAPNAADVPDEHPEGVSGWPAVALALLLVITFSVRLYQIRDLVLPAWVDSVHHALMIRVAIEQGRAPISLLPYMPIEQLPYHWGYHVITAASAQIARVTVPQVMLWQGQTLNALHVLTCAALAAFLWRRPWAGVVAGLVVGLLSIMPAFYVSWGRYTQLSGLLLLPPLAICWNALLTTQRRRHIAEVALLLAGLNLIHFRVLVLALALLAAQTVVALVASEHAGSRFAALLRGGVAAVVAVLLTAPWLWLLVENRLAPLAARPQAVIGSGTYGNLNEGLLWAGHNRTLFALALLGALVALHGRSRVALVVMLWVGGMITLANPGVLAYILPAAALPLVAWAWQQRRPVLALAVLPLLLFNPLLVRLPASWLISNDSVVISLFVPAAVLIGYLADRSGVMLARRVGEMPVVLLKHRSAAVLATVLLVAAWGAYDMRDVINADTVFAYGDDLDALQWINTQTPLDARFLIGATPWLPSADRGVDGGWWILPLTGRWMSTPPVIFDYGPAEAAAPERARTRVIAALQPGEEALLAALIERDAIGYVYLREGVGPLRPTFFADPQRYQQVYQQGGITILAVIK